MVMEIAVHLTSLINDLKQKNMELKFPFSVGVDFCETKRRGSLYITHKPPRQKFFEF